MFPRNIYESIVSAYRKIRAKYASRRYSFIAAAVLLLFIIAGLIIFAQEAQYEYASAEKNINQVLNQQKIVPFPTDMDPNFLTQVNECFIPIAAAYGYTLRISDGFRTVAEQDELYNQGRTVNGHIVTEAPGGKSIHNFGFAVDVVDRWREYDINWDKLRNIGAFCGLEPSDEGDISHFEYRDGLTTADFAVGKRPAPLTLPCAIMDERAKAGEPLTLKDLQNCGAPKF